MQMLFGFSLFSGFFRLERRGVVGFFIYLDVGFGWKWLRFSDFLGFLDFL
jgi:hypothetical protein